LYTLYTMAKRERKSLYTTGEIAALCQVTKRTVITWIDSGKLKAHRLPGGRHRRVAAQDIAEFMKGYGIPDLERLFPRRRILVVDDDPDFAALLEDALRDRYEVAVAGSALEAATRMGEFHPDLVLLDVRLPDVNGLEACRHFLARNVAGSRPVVFVMSAYGREIGRDDLARSGADHFFPKPIEIADLRRRIRGRVG
jgi:excisionase family DNA binding protein